VGFEPQQGQTKEDQIGICLFSMTAWVRARISWFGIGIICLGGATCLFADCYFSELAL